MATDPAPRPPEKVLNDKESPKSKITTPPTSNFMNNNNNDNNNKGNGNASETKKQKSKTIENDILMAKTPQNDDTDTTIIERTLQLATQAVIVNKRITTPVTLELKPILGKSNINIALAHLNIFISMKKTDPTLKLITDNSSIDTVMQFPKGEDYTKVFTNLIKDNRTSTVYVTHKIESAKSVSDLKHGNNSDMTNILSTLVENGGFLKHQKFQSHKEHAIGFFVQISPKVTLRENLRERIQDVLMWIDIEDEQTKDMLVEIKDNEGNPTGKQRILIPAFDIYSKEIGEGQGRDRVTTFAYEIRTSPENSTMLKNLLCKISSENILDLKFIPYGLDKQTNQRTLREIILQQNIFLEEMAIVPITGLEEKDKQEVDAMLSRSLYFMGMEPTRKSREEGRYLLVTTKAKKLNAQREADNLLSKYYKKQPSSNSNNNQGRRVTRTPTYFSSYASVLADKHPTTNSTFNIKRPNILNQRPVTISFSTNNTNQSTFGYSPSTYKFPGQNSPNEYPPLSYDFSGQKNTSQYNHYKPNPNTKDDSSNHSNKSLKRKATSDNNSLITQSTVDLTQETPNWKEELDKIVKESNKQMSEKIELQNKQMKATIKESVNSTLLDFQSHIISSVKGMMDLQLEQINKSIADNIKISMQSSQMIKKQFPKLSAKTIKNISLQSIQEPTKDLLNNISPTQNDNTTPMQESESNLDSLTQYESNTASSNLQMDNEDLSWEEENNSLDQTNDMIVDNEGEEDEDEEEDEDDLYTKVDKEKRGKKDNKKINKKSSVSKPNKPQTRLGSKKT